MERFSAYAAVGSVLPAASDVQINERAYQSAVQFYDNGIVKIAYYDLTPELLKNPTHTVVLLHGFPYDVHAFTQVAKVLCAENWRVIVPYLRGYGLTEYSDPGVIRTGQQSALGADLISLLEYLQLDSPILAGYDWGGRAGCVTSALRPNLVHGLVTAQGYNIFSQARARRPAAPIDEFIFWYQWYFCTERGVEGLTQNRYNFCQLLWKLWSPGWEFTPDEYALTAASFDNPDFVATVISAYRHRYGTHPGDRRYESLEQLLEQRPPITVPTIIIVGDNDGVHPQDWTVNPDDFPNLVGNITVADCGHNIPQEQPEEFVAAIKQLV